MDSDFKRKNYSIKIPKALRLSIKATQLVSQKASFKIAKNLFFMPIDYKAQEEEFLYKQSIPMNREYVDGKKISVFLDGNPPFKVLLVHGWSGHASQFQKMGEAFRKDEISYVSFTAPAHGSSPDKKSDMMEFVDSIEYINKKYGPFDTLIGHSLGAVAAINAASSRIKVKKIVCIGAPATVGESIHDFCYFLGFSEEVEKMMVSYLEEKYDASLEAYSAKNLAESTKAKGLILHDVKDHSVDVKSAQLIHDNWKNSELVMTDGLGHNKILSDPDVIEKIVDFIKE